MGGVLERLEEILDNPSAEKERESWVSFPGGSERRESPEPELERIVFCCGGRGK